jgi:flavoprotein
MIIERGDEMKFSENEYSNNPKQEALDESKRILKNIKEKTDDKIKVNLENYISKSDNLTKKDIELIMEISSAVTESYFKEYAKVLSQYQRTLKHSR